MTSTDPAEQQREIVCAFRMAAADRASREAAAEVRFKQDQDAAKARLAGARATADRRLKTTLDAAAVQRDTECSQIEVHFKQVDLAESQIAEVRAAVQAIASKELPAIGLKPTSDVSTVGPPVPANLGGTRPGEAFVQAAGRAKALAGDLRLNIERVRRQRSSRAERRFLLRFGASLSLVVALPVGYSAYHSWQKEQLYQAATAAIKAQQWDAARSSLQQLIVLGNGVYKDEQTLLQESYYRPAVAAIGSAQWELAAKELAQLGGSSSNYKDVKNLIATRPELRRALDALNTTPR